MIEFTFLFDYMYHIVFGLVSFFIGSLLLKILFKEKPYIGYKVLFSDCEIKFLRVLEEVSSFASINLKVMGKVRVADLVKMDPNLRGKSFWKHFSKISQIHVDYVLLDKRNFTVIAGIELDDSSHKKRIKEDAFKDKVFQDINIPLLRIKPQKSYCTQSLKEEILSIKHSKKNL